MRVWLLLLLTLVSGLAWAAGAPVPTTPSAHSFWNSDLVNQNTDVSLSYLGQLFGSVGTTLHSNTGQLVGQLFYKLNQGFCVIAGLWLTYTVSSTVFKASQEGTFMGQNRNAAFIFLRISIGMGMLIPLPSTGYSVFQETVMQVVTQGVGFADQTWSWALDYLKNGGKIYTDPSVSSMGSADGDAGFTLSGDGKNIADAVRGAAQRAVCSYTYQNNLSDDSGALGLSGNQSTIWSVNNHDHLYQFPKDAGASSGCGSIDWGVSNYCDVKKDDPKTPPKTYEQLVNDSAGGDDTSRNTLICTIQKQAVLQVLSDVAPAAKNYAKALKSNSVTDSDRQMLASSIVNATTDYMGLSLPMRRLIQNQQKDSALDFVANAKKEGWFMAGRYYWDLINAGIDVWDPDKVSHDSNNPNNGGSSLFKLKGLSPPATGISSGDHSPYAEITTTYGSVNDDINAAFNATQTTREKGGSGSTGDEMKNGFGSTGSFVASFLLGTIMPFMGGFTMLVSSFHDVGSDPILFLHWIGNGCLTTMVDIWVGAAMYSGMVSIVAGVCDSVQPAGLVVQAIGDWMRPILLGCAALLIGAGIMLGYYVPLYPWMVFMFAAFGWLISVIEAMVAAPLVCLGLTHPEGHDFLGKVEQALMLLLGVFLRPVLMIVGLIIAMILGYVSLRVLNYSFTGILSSAFNAAAPPGASDISTAASNVGAAQTGMIITKSGSLGAALNVLSMGPVIVAARSILLPIIIMAALFVIYAGMVFMLVNQVYGLIYIVPDKIMRWVGTPAEQSDVSGSIQQVRGTMGGSTGMISYYQSEQSAKAAGDGADKTAKHYQSRQGGLEASGNGSGAEGGASSQDGGDAPAAEVGGKGGEQGKAKDAPKDGPMGAGGSPEKGQLGAPSAPPAPGGEGGGSGGAQPSAPPAPSGGETGGASGGGGAAGV